MGSDDDSFIDPINDSDKRKEDEDEVVDEVDEIGIGDVEEDPYALDDDDEDPYMEMHSLMDPNGLTEAF